MSSVVFNTGTNDLFGFGEPEGYYGANSTADTGAVGDWFANLWNSLSVAVNGKSVRATIGGANFAYIDPSDQIQNDPRFQKSNFGQTPSFLPSPTIVLLILTVVVVFLLLRRKR